MVDPARFSMDGVLDTDTVRPHEVRTDPIDHTTCLGFSCAPWQSEVGVAREDRRMSAIHAVRAVPLPLGEIGRLPELRSALDAREPGQRQSREGDVLGAMRVVDPQTVDAGSARDVCADRQRAAALSGSDALCGEVEFHVRSLLGRDRGEGQAPNF